MFYVNYQELLVFHSFINVGRTHEIPGSEKRDCIIHSTASSMSISIIDSVPIATCTTGAKRMGTNAYQHIQWVALQKRNPDNPCLLVGMEALSLFYWVISVSTLCLGRRHYVTFSRLFAIRINILEYIVSKKGYLMISV